MHIAWMRIQNFKSLRSADFHFNADLNVLTGVNNSGKTTVLEAISLWAECFQKLLRQADRAVTKVGVRRGDFRLGHPNHNYFDHAELISSRSTGYGDIFHLSAEDEAAASRPIEIEANLVHEEQVLQIGFSVRASAGSSYDIVLKNAERFPVREFNDFFQRFPEPINVVYASPVALLLPREEFELRPKISARIRSRQSVQVLRNRLYQLKKDATRYQRFESDVSYILSDGKLPVTLSFEGDEARDVELGVKVQLGPRDLPKDISLLGSGTLQILEILLALYAEPRDLNLILLDEPDSYIHRDIQRRLVAALQKHVKVDESAPNAQIFLATHNEGLIRSTDARHLFHLEAGRERAYHPVYRDQSEGRGVGLQPSRQIKILKTLGSETSLDLLNALEADRLILVEGEDDARFIQAIVEKASLVPVTFRAMYWSFGGVEEILKTLPQYRSFFEQIGNGKSLWGKVVLVFDPDHLTAEQRAAMQAGLQKKLKRPVYVWRSYTVEATVFAEPSKLKGLVHHVLQSSAGVTTHLDDVSRRIDQALTDLVSALRERIRAPKAQSELFHRLRTRQEHLRDSFEISNVFQGGEGRLQPDFLEYANRLLDQGQVHHLATKDDVAELVLGIFKSFSAPPPSGNLFEALIEASNPSTRFMEWDELTKVVTENHP
ncbi:Hypothetical protein CAP_4633 [Chondromyces apiculatus DSM 436]|uniref:ATPase AAA-type core domain-containing protein n=1 Tax=Chondromyces apiculatus DSM 436 TaxID=1192034 RepID=A0A017T556_9BACT|nr:Hypothetical protein CAP_4633 [Chondromyces apiculatus DSM 436]